MNFSDVPVFILAGGFGTRLKEMTEFRPKPMIEIGGRPILWHIMRLYSCFGFKRFIICAGFKQEVIKQYFMHYDAINSDFTARLREHSITYHGTHHEDDWEVTVANTGEQTMTGGRIGIAASRYLGGAEHFAVTYGDGLTDANLEEEFRFHLAQEATGTVLGINPPSRFGELGLTNNVVHGFSEKPKQDSNWINGGYFFFRRSLMNHISNRADLVLEKEPLTDLARTGGLRVWRHTGFWACMDTQRDKDQLEELWASGRAPWVHANNARPLVRSDS